MSVLWNGKANACPQAPDVPDTVEGDLVELDPEVLRQLRGEIDRIDVAPVIPNHVTGPAAMTIKHRHWERQRGQAELRKAIQLWAGWQSYLGRPDREIMRRFFFGFGVDIATAQTLNLKDATELEGRIRSQLVANNVTEAAI